MLCDLPRKQKDKAGSTSSSSLAWIAGFDKLKHPVPNSAFSITSILFQSSHSSPPLQKSPRAAQPMSSKPQWLQRLQHQKVLHGRPRPPCASCPEMQNAELVVPCVVLIWGNCMQLPCAQLLSKKGCQQSSIHFLYTQNSINASRYVFFVFLHRVFAF